METLHSERHPYGDAKPTKIRLKRRKSPSSHAKRRRRNHHSSSSSQDYAFTHNGEYDDPSHRYRESIYDGIDSDTPQSFSHHTVDADEAFRESLFDALADDEGAAYWEGVYGQPVHVYPQTKLGPDGSLERMGDEEYAEYVRTKMWEKSHQHIVEQRKASERARKRDKERRREAAEQTSRQAEHREYVRLRMEDTLRRGQHRKKAKEAAAAWSLYEKKWDELKSQALDQNSAHARDLIPWPTASAESKHMSKRDIEDFFERSAAWKTDAIALLKIERVRWHPDKMQQRFGQDIDTDTLKAVTAVFQVVDRLWSEQRK